MSENSGNKNGRPEALTELDYFESARVIALYLDQWCDKNLIYPDMIADASRKVKAAFDELESDMANLYFAHNEVCKENVKLKAENECLKQQSLGTQLVTAIAGIPYVPSNELELAMLKAENEALRAKSKLLHGCPACGEEWTNLDEMLDIEKERDNYRNYADQLAQSLKILTVNEENKNRLEQVDTETLRGIVLHTDHVAREALAEYAKFREGKND